MKAIVVHGDSPPQLVWEEVADVTMGPDEVLVDVRATAVNRADLSQARGNYPPPPGASEILGLEMAGVIREVGREVRDWQVSDRVCALLPGGGYAEQASVPQGMLLRLPDDWTFEQGAAVPEVWYTAFVNLFLEGELREGESVLLHAAASGVGTAAIQLAVDAGATVFATAGSEEKLAACRDLGASLVVNRHDEDFLPAVLEVTDGRGVDVILCPVGGAYLERNVSALARYGRLVHIGLLGGRTGELNLGQVMGKRLTLVGSTLRTRPLEEKIAITRRFEAEVWPKFAAGTLRPIIDTTFPIQDAQAAHDYVLANRNTGKVVLKVEGV